MPLLRLKVAAVAAFAAAQVGLASESDGASSSSSETGLVGFPSLFSDAVLGPDGGLRQSISSLWSFISSMQGMSPTASSLISLSLAEDDERSCQVSIGLGDSVPIKDLRVGLDTTGRRVIVSYKSETTEEQHDPEKGDRRSSSSLYMSRSLGLPERCMATPTALLFGLAGFMLDSSSETQNRRGKIILPSATLLGEYAEQGLLPENIVEMIGKGEVEQLGDLTPEQRCLAAGFTTSDCKKLGNEKPQTTPTLFENAENVIPIPRYDVSLHVLD